jgi:hypothetical protein
MEGQTIMYKIEIWRYHDLVETYEDYDVEEVLRWYKANWRDCYEWGQCAFTTYKDDVELSFEEERDLGFYS